MRENIPYNANIVPSIVGRGHLYMRPLDQNRGKRPIHPLCGYAHNILAAVWGQLGWYNLGHNIYRLPPAWTAEPPLPNFMMEHLLQDLCGVDAPA